MRATRIDSFKRELGAYLRSPVGWVVASLALLIDGILFQSQALTGENLSAEVLRRFFWSTSGVTMIAAVLLSIRLLAEERQQHSMVLLNTSPVRDVEIVLGKFLAALVFLAGMVLLSVYMPLLIKVHGKVSFAQIAVGYLGLLLLGMTCLAMGVFASALTRHQLVAGVAAAAIVVIFILFYYLAQILDPPVKGIVNDLSLWWGHYEGGFMNGVFNLKDVVYYLAVTYLFLLLSVKTLEAKRWDVIIPLPKRLLGVSLAVFGGLTAGGLLALVLGERGFYHNGDARLVFDVLGVGLLVAIGALRLINTLTAKGERRRAELIPLLCHAGVLLSLIVYLFSTKTGMGWLGYTDLDSKAADKTHAIVEVAWAIIALVSIIPLLMSDFAVGVRRFGDQGAGAEYVRTREAAISGLSVGLAAAFLFVTCNVAGERNIRRDVSYFKTSEPGESTAAIVMNTAKPVRALLFFPEVNEVEREVQDYFEALSAKTGGKLTVEVHDVEVDKSLAEHYKVTKQGTVLLTVATADDDKNDKLVKPPKTVMFEIDTDLEKARRGKTGKLRTLDREVNKQLITLMRDKLKVYLTVGHGEINDPNTAPQNVPQRHTQLMRSMLGQDQYELADLNWTTLASGVPDDASAVFVLGASTGFRPEEQEQLDKYLAKGGHMLIALDPRGDNDLGPLEGRLGVAMAPGLLNDDAKFFDQHHGAFDHRFPVTNQFSAHASTTQLSRASVNAYVLLIEAGSLVDKPFTSTGEAPKRTPVIHSMPTAWMDLDGHGTFDADTEKRDRYVVAEAIEGPKLTGDDGKEKDGFRALVTSDADLFADLPPQIGGLPGGPLIEDATKWLAGEAVIAGEVVSEEDVAIQHTRSRDQIWFYLTIVGVPLVVLGVGLLLTLRRRGAPQPRKVAS